MEVPQEGNLHGFPLANPSPVAEAKNLWPLSMDNQPTAFQTLVIPAQTNIATIMARAAQTSEVEKCPEGDDSQLCQKSTTASSMTLPIVLGVCIPLVGACLALWILHRRHVKKQNFEDANDRHASLDFGLGNQGGNKWNKQRGVGKEMPLNDGSDLSREKSHKHGMSFDMMSPYILPAGLNHSTDSLHSLSRNLKEPHDPYGPVNDMKGDGVSVRSFGGRKDGTSVYTAKSNLSGGNAGLVGNASAMGRSPSDVSFHPPPRNGSMPQQSPALSPIGISPIEPAYFPNQNNNSLAPGGAQDSRESYMGQDAAALRLSNNYLSNYIAGGDSKDDAAAGRDNQESPFADSAAVKMPDEPRRAASRSPSPPPAFMMPTTTSPPRGDSLNQANANGPSAPLPQIPIIQQIPTIADPVEWKEDQYHDNDSFYVTPPSPKDDFAAKAAKRASRYSMDVPPEEYAKAGLGAPGVNPQRISMGFRPLPPASLLAAESDDPEIRANRIRSFYKEYFDDSKPAPAGQYYEDYDDGQYRNDIPPVPPMPQYQEPMQRRAMTPPPNAGRYMGQQFPPRSEHGSLNNFGPQGGYGGPPRGQFRGPDSRATSRNGSMTSQSSQWRGPPGFTDPRPFSSASNRGRPNRPGTQQSQRPVAPPEDLRTMPTPAMLKDDMFGMINAHEFAPPTTYAERSRGRSQSPMGERKKYEVKVPVANTLVSAFDELAVIPSPHLLRKSGTFTSLDFAPPKRVFKDQDTMSDAGSIRSNRSGVSNTAMFAIRSGANRVSRLPADQVMTKDSMNSVLKPTWGSDMRT